MELREISFMNTYQNSGDARLTKSLQHAVDAFEPVSLEEMDNVKLLDRFDRKFVFRIEKLGPVFRRARSKYRALQIDDHRIFDYHSLYYDTPDYRMYMDHHNRKLNRFKVRKREYLTSGIRFFEVKFKINKGRTRKKRIAVDNAHRVLCKEERKFLKKHTPYTADMLEPKLENRFSRITLVHNIDPERITIDFRLEFNTNGDQLAFPFLCIAEIKQDRNSGISDLEKFFKEYGILPMKFSKYCIGSILLDRTLKYNRFKQKLITLNKLCNDSSSASVLIRS